MSSRFTGLLAAALALASSAWADGVDDGFKTLAAARGQREPLMRIGLEASHRVLISSLGKLRILDPASGKPVWKEALEGEIAVVAEGGPRGPVPSLFRIQVGAYSSRESADSERARLEGRFRVPVVVRHIPDRDSWRVRLGEASSRDELAPLLEKLRAEGMQGIWIVEEPARVQSDVTLRIIDASYESLATGMTRLAVVPAGRGRVRVEDKPYRGVIELRVTPFGTVLPINWIHMETYLLGVVPAELGPEQWPQLEALKAQAVAARTYAWRHRGQFDDEGFDLCATPRCQVYEGAEVEHPLSDRAVMETGGEILSWQGEPITALYTAACGGHTEDGGEIFPEEAAPYLVGVACRAETEALSRLTVKLKGAPLEPLIAEDGRDVTRDLAVLAAAGVLAEPLSFEKLDRPVRPEQLRRWTRALAGLAGRPVPDGPPGSVDDLAEAAASLVRDLGWLDRAEVLLDEADLPALLRDPEASRLPIPQRRALAYLALTEGLRPYPDGSFQVKKKPSAARLLPALARVGEAYDAFEVSQAIVSGRMEGGIRVFRGKGEVRLRMDERPYLFGLSGGRTVPAVSLDLYPGDRVRYRTNPEGRIDFLELIPPVKGTADDRTAALFSWEVRRSRREVEEAVNRRVAVGRLSDLRVLRRGRSGRVVELEVVGDRSSTVVRGFDIRRLLGLRESLTVIEVQRDTAGRVAAVVFAGKGWGHGVGLCQVGAYGMALRDSDYRSILSHYYRGALLERIRPGEK